MNTINEEMQKHIDLVATEIFNTTGARVLASASGIAEGIECPDQLYQYCMDLIGYEATVEGYFDGDRYLDEPKDGELHLGHGIPFNAFEAYLSLREQFGVNWLAAVLEAAQSEVVGILEPSELIEIARGHAVNAAILQMGRRVFRAAEETQEGIKQLKNLALPA